METDFIPTTPEFITKDWLVMVINQYRRVHQQSLLRSPEDIKDLSCAPHPWARGILSNSYQVPTLLPLLINYVLLPFSPSPVRILFEPHVPR